MCNEVVICIGFNLRLHLSGCDIRHNTCVKSRNDLYRIVKVRRDGHRYLKGIEEREDAGTPQIVGSIRAGLVFQLKDDIGSQAIMKRDSMLVRLVCECRCGYRCAHEYYLVGYVSGYVYMCAREGVYIYMRVCT